MHVPEESSLMLEIKTAWRIPRAACDASFCGSMGSFYIHLLRPFRIFLASGGFIRFVSQYQAPLEEFPQLHAGRAFQLRLGSCVKDWWGNNPENQLVLDFQRFKFVGHRYQHRVKIVLSNLLIQWTLGSTLPVQMLG
jgi:hypothetical protein